MSTIFKTGITYAANIKNGLQKKGYLMTKFRYAIPV